MTLDELPDRYSTILCDVWGVIHDGGRLYPGVCERFARWREEGRTLVILTNAPRPADRVERGLERMGLDRSLWKALTSSGQAGIEALTHPVRPVGFCGLREDFEDLEAHGVCFASAQEPHDEIALTGLDEQRDRVSQYDADLDDWLQRGMTLHCLNPDRIVVHRGERVVCAGALADEYERRGGKAIWYGKPEAPIFDHALQLAGNPPLDEVVMIGDGPHTDMLGACRKGIDAIFVRGGIQEGEEYDWSEEFGDWRPLMTVSGL
ncbi:TIGR01459 family HAD-type hydrolase [Sphingomicrobium lutaoense]|uniref:HAD superfamily hydrolase (TIGR01459 family) n=1 Tax=Sphingomicrobium lutaoense TaxID=515949 RepID=A0A839YZ86_9SPHN|nr:TIGR01459 family HAD-type hydrolase [Sphingomicrobium lutaoense]MBB3763638.1 HAD superfamily hydrolase (TIGR01459 family) [Sphingomicrobium lutaoense]